MAQTPPVADDFVRTLMGLVTTYIGLVLVLVALWFWLVVRMVRRITVRLSDTDLLALRSVSVLIPLSIDAVDFGLDFVGAPLAWFIANQTALKPLRGASFFEGLVPGTQLIPSMTLGWYWANHVRRDGPWPAGYGGRSIGGVGTAASDGGSTASDVGSSAGDVGSSAGDGRT